MATVTNFANAFETTLTADMLGTDLTAQVQTTDGAPSSPCYLVIDPHNDDKREYVLFDGTFTTTSFVTTALANRYLDGSAAASGITHAAGAIVRFAPVAQHFDDLHGRIDTDVAALDAHKTDATLGSAGPHPGQFAATGLHERIDKNGTTVAAFQQTIDEAAAVGRSVWIDAIYAVDAQLTLPSGASMRGVGPASGFKVADAAPMFNVLVIGNGRQNVQLRNFTVDGNRALAGDGTDTNGISVYFAGVTGNTAGHVIDGLNVVNSRSHGIRLHNDDLANPYELAIRNTTVRNCFGNGIWLNRPHEASIENCLVEDNGESGIQVYRGVGHRLHGNRCLGNRWHGIVLVYAQDFTVAGNVCLDNGARPDGASNASGIALGGGSDTEPLTARYAVVGNLCGGNNAHGITIDPTRAGAAGVKQRQDGTVAGNTCRDSLVFHGIYLENASYLSLTGNVCHGNAESGILANAASVVVSGNQAHGNGLWGLVEPVATGVEGNEYTGNDFAGNTQGWASIAGAATPTGFQRVAHDFFQRPDAVSLGDADMGGAWTAAVGDWGITNNLAQHTGGGSGTRLAFVEASAADVVVRAKVTWHSAAGLAFRVIDATNFLFAQLNGGSVTIHKRDAGANTTLATATTSAQLAGRVYDLEVRALKDRIVLLRNGVVVLTYTLSAADQTKYGGATKQGLSADTTATTNRWDDFSVRA